MGNQEIPIGWFWGILVFTMPMLAFPVASLAQTCCSGGVPLGGSLSIGTAESQSLLVVATYDYNAIKDLVSFSERLKDQSRSRTTKSSILEINYGLNQRFSITGGFPYISQTRTIEAFTGEDFTVVRGLGDMVFLVKYRVTNPEKFANLDWVVAAGPKIPSAKTDHVNNQGLSLAADMQPGSGSYDGIFWSYFLKSRFLKNPNLGLVAVATYRYTGENKNYNNSQTYRFGNEFQFNLGVNYNLFLGRPIDVFTYMRYRNQSEDLIDDGIFPSSGGQWVYVTSGANISLTPNWSLRFSGDLPLYRNLDGTQLTTSYKLTASIMFNIPLAKEDSFIY